MADTHPKGRHVNFQRCLGNIQEPRNLAVRQSLSEEGQDLALAMGEFRMKIGLARHGQHLPDAELRRHLDIYDFYFYFLSEQT